MNEALLVAILLDLGAGYRRGERHAAAERLGDREKIRHDAVLLEAEIGADPAERGLRLVQDQEHAARLAQLLQPRKIALRRHDHAARAEDRLDDRGGERARALLVDLLEADLQAARSQAPAQWRIGQR